MAFFFSFEKRVLEEMERNRKNANQWKKLKRGSLDDEQENGEKDPNDPSTLKSSLLDIHNLEQ